MALTLIEAAKAMKGEDFRATIIELFASQSDLLRVLPFKDITGGSYRYNQEDTLPGIAFRGVGEGYTESTGVINPQTENLVIVGGDLDVDKFIVRTQGPDHRTTQETMKLKALSHNFANTVISGDSVTVAKEFDGLQVRLTGAQVVNNSTAADGAGLSLGQLDAAIDACDNPTHILMTQLVKRRLSAAARDTTIGGFITFQQDELGRQQTLYQGLPILIADANADLFATIGTTEAYNGGGTADASSLYVLSLRDGMLQGIQNGPPEVSDLGEIDDSPLMRTRIEWYTGIVLEHPRAACRLDSIDAAVPATV